MAFGFDISDVVNFGDAENVIAVRIDNSWDYREKATNSKFQWEDKNFNANYGGITKNVFLHVTPKVYQTLPLYAGLQTTGVYIYADNYNIKTKSATIHAESEVRNESGQAQQVVYQVLITDKDGKLVFMAESNATCWVVQPEQRKRKPIDPWLRNFGDNVRRERKAAGLKQSERVRPRDLGFMEK